MNGLPNDEQEVIGFWGDVSERLRFHASDSFVDGRDAWYDMEGEEVDAPDRWEAA